MIDETTPCTCGHSEGDHVAPFRGGDGGRAAPGGGNCTVAGCSCSWFTRARSTADAVRKAFSQDHAREWLEQLRRRIRIHALVGAIAHAEHVRTYRPPMCSARYVEGSQRYRCVYDNGHEGSHNYGIEDREP